MDTFSNITITSQLSACICNIVRSGFLSLVRDGSQKNPQDFMDIRFLAGLPPTSSPLILRFTGQAPAKSLLEGVQIRKA